MKALTTTATLALLTATPLMADHHHNPADTISALVGHAASYSHFAPELPEMRARISQINTEFGLHVSEIEPNLHFVTDQIYQSAFLVTDEGVVVLDAPASFGPRLRQVIAMVAPDQPITHLIYSHAHVDHNGAAATFADIEGLTVVGAAGNVELATALAHRGLLAPTKTFEDTLDLTIGGVPINLQTAAYHAEDTDVIIHLPEQEFLMAIDTITPGEVPFMNFGATTDLHGYIESYDTFLEYDFTHFLSGHVSVLGNRDDVLLNRAYVHDVHDTVMDLMPGFLDRMGQAMELVNFEHGNLSYRMAIEGVRDDCTAQIISRWQDKLSVVDVWADSHCETVVLYAIMH